MIASWMVFGILVGCLVAVAAWLIEGALRFAGLPSRGVWLGAMVALAGLMTAAPLRRADPLVFQANVAGAERLAPVAAPGAATPLLEMVRRALQAPLRAAAAPAEVAELPLLALWAALSVALGGAGLVTLRRARLARRSWSRREVLGVPVCVSPGTGPAVMGVRRPEVVIPAWLLEADEEEQRLVVLHEQEHVRAGDPRLLAGGAALAVLMPWNPAAWWMLRRLHLAVEMDCDRRVLSCGVRARSYGEVLLHVAGRGPAFILAAPAMAGTASHLERRLRAMSNPLPRFGLVRGAALAVLGTAALAAACDTKMPTTAEVAAMDVAVAENRARPLMIADAAYFIDERPATADEAHALPADQIAQINVRKTSAGAGEIRIVTAAYAREHGLDKTFGNPGDQPGERVMVVTRQGDRVRTSSEGITIHDGGPRPTTASDSEGNRRVELSSFTGLILIDGRVASPAEMRALDPRQILSVEVTKGAAAAQGHSDPRARDGIIRITTAIPTRQP